MVGQLEGVKIAFLLLVCTSLAWADAATEAALRAELAAAQASLAQAQAKTAGAGVVAANQDSRPAQQTAAAAGAAAAAAASDATANSQNTALLITQVFGFLAVLAGFLYKAFTDARDRRWAHEDAEKRESAAVAHRGDVLAKLSEVKTEASNAYREANNINAKIEAIGLRAVDASKL